MFATDFAVPRWLKSPHLQTLGAAAPLFSPPRSHTHVSTDELRFALDDTHRLHARVWWADADRRNEQRTQPGRTGRTSPAEPVRRPTVVLVHGIGGSSQSHYVVRSAVALHRKGYHVVRLDLRGAGASIPDVPTLYHAGLSADLSLVLDELAKDERVANLALLGFSGGGSLALKLAGEWGQAVPRSVSAIASVSAPLDYVAVGPWMDAVGRLPYRFHVLRGLSRGAREFARQHPARAHYRPEDVKRMSSFRHYDGTIIVPMHGFSDVDAYYEAASSGRWLDRITVPTLLVHADDDPMVPGFTVHPWLPRASNAVRVEVSRHGGHIGWVSGFDERSWVENFATRRVLSFLDEATGLGEALERTRAA